MANQAERLALILQAIEDTERERKDWTKDWQSRMERLHNQAWSLRNEILSGQLSFVAEPPKEGAA
jgi:hypothetical protein